MLAAHMWSAFLWTREVLGLGGEYGCIELSSDTRAIAPNQALGHPQHGQQADMRNSCLGSYYSQV